jgi:hypothetical protein
MSDKYAVLRWLPQSMLMDAPMMDDHLRHELEVAAARADYELRSVVSHYVMQVEPMLADRETADLLAAGYVPVRAEAEVARIAGSQPEGSEW